MPADWEDDVWQDNNPTSLINGIFDVKSSKSNNNNNGITLRPPLYNAEDYISALRQLFTTNPSHRNIPHNISQQQSSKNMKSKSALIEHSSSGKDYNNRDFPETPPEMCMKKFLNGSELLFKLEADLRHAYPTFGQEFISVHCEGVNYLLEALKIIQTAIDEVTGLREQRKLLMDEQKCLQCVQLCLRNVEAVSKLSAYPGGLYPVAAAMISTVSATRVIALEILTMVCSEGGPEGHFKVSEAISTLRLRMGEPIRCKLLIGAISSAPPGKFQAKGIKFLTAWVASAGSNKQKVHLSCELEEAGFNPAVLRKSADLGGARESREVHTELDAWDRVSIDVDTLTRQNCQLRNSVATLQQELATLKDKLKRMDVKNKSDEVSRKKTSRQKRIEDLVTTPADSEEEAEQIHQLLEDLNNIVNSELNGSTNNLNAPPKATAKKREQEIVPVQLIKSPPPRKTSNSTNNSNSQIPKAARPWPSSSASDEDDDSSDLIQTPSPKLATKDNVRKVVEQIEKSKQNTPGSKLYTKNNSKSKSMSPMAEPKPDYLPNFHKQNHMASKFANFKSSKLYSSSPDNSPPYKLVPTEVFDFSKKHQQNIPAPRFSPELMSSRKKPSNKESSNGLRRSESMHTSLASVVQHDPRTGGPVDNKMRKKQYNRSNSQLNIDKWKSMDNLETEVNDSNFTLRWKYPHPEMKQAESKIPALKSKSKKVQETPPEKTRNGSNGSKGSSSGNGKNGAGVFELFNDYRQNRFVRNTSKSNMVVTSSSPVNGSSNNNIFAKYTKKQNSDIPNGPGININHNESITKESSMKMFSLPPIFVSQGIDLTNHRICDLPSGLY